MFNYLLYRLGQFIALSLPVKVGYKIAVIISDLHYIFSPADRQAVWENLKAIFPEKQDHEIRGIRIRMFRNFAKYLVDFFRFSVIDKEYIKKNIRIENAHYVDEALAKGKGVIILSAHLGNWELGAVVMAQLGYPFWVVALPHKYKKVDDFFISQRQGKGIKVIPLGRAARACINLLQEKEMVALVGDRDFSGKGQEMEFFGKTAHLPEGPAAVSLKTGAIILPAFMLRNPDDSFTLSFEAPIKFNPTEDKSKDLLDLMRLSKTVIEDYIRKYPDQWYMFRRFWVA
jgi:KDO2-lipid IV(A) lauroyltransferase